MRWRKVCSKYETLTGEEIKALGRGERPLGTP